MGFAISLACCGAGDCHYLSKTLPFLEPFESTFLPQLPHPGCFCLPKALACPRGPELHRARGLSDAGGWVGQGAAQGELRDPRYLSLATRGPERWHEGWKGRG